MVVERGDLLGRREDELGHDRSDPQMTILKCTINRRRHNGRIDLLITVVILNMVYYFTFSSTELVSMISLPYTSIIIFMASHLKSEIDV